MRNIFVTVFLLLVTLAHAQTAREETLADVNLTAGNYRNYPAPRGKLTPAPSGYAPFYISHYGRHGSRYLISRESYAAPLRALRRAEASGKLTPLGVSVLRRVELMEQDSRSRLGELTTLGARQHRDIARRMMTRFPEVFADSASVDAKSTIVIRCILSMENELVQLASMNPRLRITSDASEHDMYYMNQRDDSLYRRKENHAVASAYKQLSDSLMAPVMAALGSRLFSDECFPSDSVSMGELGYQLCELAWILQDTDRRDDFTLYDMFGDGELYHVWQVANAWWYAHYGACALNGGTQPYSQRNLLRRIIHEADSCIALYSRPEATPATNHGATLRFGHETMVMPLTCLLGLNGYDLRTGDLRTLEQKGWVSYRIFPMGANIQFVFYRPTSSAGGGDILVKVLLNEEEATLPHPISPVAGPYYRWSDVRAFYINRLNQYTED